FGDARCVSERRSRRIAGAVFIRWSRPWPIRRRCERSADRCTLRDPWHVWLPRWGYAGAAHVIRHCDRDDHAACDGAAPHDYVSARDSGFEAALATPLSDNGATLLGPE